MRKLKFKLDRSSLQMIYISFIRPVLEYADAVWDNCNQTEAYELKKIYIYNTKLRESSLGLPNLYL